jgi:peroxiredoxin
MEIASSTAVCSLRAGASAPGFALPDSMGTIVRLKAYKQRRPVLLALLHSADCPHCLAWLGQLAAVRGELEDLKVETMLVFPDEPDALRALQCQSDIPARLLSDPLQQVRARYLLAEDSASAADPVLLVAINRYSYCLDRWLANEPSAWPLLSAPLATFALAEQDDCACGVPIWAAEEA